MAKIINGSTIYLALADYLATNAYINDTAQDVLVMVAKWIDEAPEVNGWIPVTERLPEEDVLVLCVGAKGGMFLGYPRTLYRDVDYAYTRVPNARGSRHTKYWMPLPEPPKEVEDA